METKKKKPSQQRSTTCDSFEFFSSRLLEPFHDDATRVQKASSTLGQTSLFSAAQSIARRSYALVPTDVRELRNQLVEHSFLLLLLNVGVARGSKGSATRCLENSRRNERNAYLDEGLDLSQLLALLSLVGHRSRLVGIVLPPPPKLCTNSSHESRTIPLHTPIPSIHNRYLFQGRFRNGTFDRWRSYDIDGRATVRFGGWTSKSVGFF